MLTVAKKSKQKIFNDRPRKVFRKRIPASEVLFSAAFVGIVLAMGAWFVQQRDNYDPSERDISMEVMLASSVEDQLYKAPLQRWVDPSLAVQGGPAAPDIGLMPDVILENGWQASSRLEEFDKSNLYEKINGQEVQYHSYGFQFLHFISVRNDGEELDANIEVYDMGEFSNALGIFAAQRSEGTTVEKSGPAFLYETEAGGIGLVGKYYVKVTGSANSPVMRQFGRDFVVAFADEHSASVDIPRPMAVLTEGMGIDFAELDYVREDAFQYAFAKEFWFGRPDRGAHTRYFVHEAASAEQAQVLVVRILEEHQYDYTAVEGSGTVPVLQHNFLKNYFTIAQVGAFVLGVERAETQEEALAGTAALRDSIAGEDAGDAYEAESEGGAYEDTYDEM